MYIKKLSQPKNSLLKEINLNVSFVVGDESFEILKKDLANNFLKIILEKNEENKNLLKEQIEILKKFANLKTQEKRYFLTNLNIRNTQIQNILLKILEESDKNMYFIFVIPNTSILLKTILSRGEVIFFEDHTFDQDFINKVNHLKQKNNFLDLEKLLKVKSMYSLGTISEKQYKDYLNIL